MRFKRMFFFLAPLIGISQVCFGAAQVIEPKTQPQFCFSEANSIKMLLASLENGKAGVKKIAGSVFFPPPMDLSLPTIKGESPTDEEAAALWKSRKMMLEGDVIQPWIYELFKDKQSIYDPICLYLDMWETVKQDPESLGDLVVTVFSISLGSNFPEEEIVLVHHIFANAQQVVYEAESLSQ